MAALWKLPVVYVIENNRYGMGTSVARASASHDLYVRGAALRHPGRAGRRHECRSPCKAAAEIAVEHARSGEGPYVLEMMTYRYRGHSMSDPAKYRSKDEVNRMRAEHDLIDQAKKRLLDGNLADENALKEIDKEVKDIVAAAAEFAQDSPEPDPAELWTDVLNEA